MSANTFQISGRPLIALLYESARTLVYRAIDEPDKKPVILKLLKGDYPSTAEIAAYELEFDLIQSLDIDGVIKAYALERHQRSLVIVFEDFGGITLAEYVKHAELTLDSFLDKAIRITAILGQIHQAQIVHNDINPFNIIINPQTNELKIIDFGIAAVFHRDGYPASAMPEKGGGITGTLAYISPEQTGRTSRIIDHRSDFYALGITFYEMLAGRLPFSGDDPAGLIHAQITRQPEALHRLAPRIPEPLSRIVHKLMAKTAEARYHSAAGILEDLTTCRDLYRATGAIPGFQLGRKDEPMDLPISPHFYGRQPELQRLLTACEHLQQAPGASLSPNEIILTAGYSGMGKSALMNQVRKYVVEQKGYFITGKFNRFRQNTPYSAIIDAFSDLARQILTESEARLNQWRERIQQTVGPHVGVFVSLIPEMGLIIKEWKASEALPPAESQNRLNLMIQSILKLFSDSAQPLILFLDDLQWADGASLKMISVLAGARNCYFLLLGAYRDHELTDSHLLPAILEDLRQSGTIVEQLRLQPLQVDDIAQLLTDSFNCASENAVTLAELVHQKTGGNPFFIKAFLNILGQHKRIRFDTETSVWQWSLTEIREQEITDNVIDIYAEKINQLPAEIKELIKSAAFIGVEFSVAALAFISHKTPAQVIRQLRIPVSLGLIIPIQKTFNHFKTDHASGGIFKFSHNRVQQAVRLLVPEAETFAIHQKISDYLLQHSLEAESQLFDIVFHLNKGLDPHRLPALNEQLHIIGLNIIAGNKAKAASAFETALNYYESGIALLPEKSWEKHYQMRLELLTQAAEAAYLCGQHERMRQLADEVLLNANAALDTVKIYEILIQCFSAQGKLSDALEIGISAMASLNIAFPRQPNSLHLAALYLKVRLLLAFRKIEDLAQLPPMTDPQALAAMRILSATASSAFLSAPLYYPLTVFKRLELSLKYGNNIYSAYTYAAYGIILCGVRGDIETGYRFGNLALKLTADLGPSPLKAKIYMVVNSFIRHWKEHLRGTFEQLQEGYAIGVETGEFEFGMYCMITYCLHLFYRGKNLALAENELNRFRASAEELKQKACANYAKVLSLVIDCIKGEGGLQWEQRHASPHAGEHRPVDKMTDLREQLSPEDRMGHFLVHFFNMFLCYLSYDYESAIGSAKKAESYIDSVRSMILVPLYLFYHSLALASAFQRLAPLEQQTALNQIKKNIRKMKQYSLHAPMNHLHKYYLLKAEYHRIIKQFKAAADFYELAIAAAKANDYLNEQGLANELAADFYLAHQNHTGFRFRSDAIAGLYLEDAIYCYQRWGALAKSHQLQRRCAKLLKTRVTLPGTAQGSEPSSAGATVNDIGCHLDLNSIMKALQIISAEIIFDNLLNKLMNIMMETAGATKGFLMLTKNQGLMIEAFVNTNENSDYHQRSMPPEECPDLSNTIVQYVKRTKQSMVLDDASGEEIFSRDPYLIRHKPKSILCIPIVRQGELIGVLYLEHNEISGAFTQNRVSVLQLLASQAAISIDNARLYTKYRSLFENALEGLFQCSANGRFLSVNPAFIRLLGYYSAEDMHASVPDIQKLFILKEDYQRIETLIRDKGKQAGVETQVYRKDGARLWVSVSGRAIYDIRGNVTHYEGSFINISERKQADIEIRKYRDELEKLVSERTLELREANNKLSKSIKEQERRTFEMTLLNYMTDLLNECRTETDTYSVVADISAQLFPKDSGYMWIYEKNSDQLFKKCLWGNHKNDSTCSAVEACLAFHTGRFHVTYPGGLSQCKQFASSKGFGTFCVPLFAQAEKIGVYSLMFSMDKNLAQAKYHPSPYDKQTDEAKRLLVVRLAEQYTLFLINLRLRDKLKMESLHDPLTGLYNRRYMEKSFEREIDRCRRCKTNLGVIMLDIDHFKTFNDSCGHAAGDQTLRKLGQYLKQNTRLEDIVCRYGGEEFILIFPDSSVENAYRRAEAIRLGIKQMTIEFETKTLNISVSMGVSGYPDHGLDAPKLITMADQALYLAKRTGRDCVAVASV